jgi:TRAP transporter TAXI family solute receptor
MQFRRAVSAAALALAFAGGAAAQESFNLTALGSAPTGILATANAGVAAAVQAAYPGSTITYQTSGSGIANIAAIDRGRAPLGYAVDAEMALALAGAAPFKEKLTSFRAIAYLVGGVGMHVVTTREAAEKYGLKEFADIAKKKLPLRIVSNARGNVVSIISVENLKEIGVSVDDVKSWGGEKMFVTSQEFPTMFADRKADTMLNMTNIRAAAMLDMMRARELVMLPVDRALVDRVAQRYGLRTMTIPKSAYDFMTADVYTTEIGIVLIAHKDVSDDHAYRIAKALVEHTDKFQSMHPAFKQTTPDYLAALKVGEYHPGAAKLYREKGLLK